jgi:hypothetical protein
VPPPDLVAEYTAKYWRGREEAADPQTRAKMKLKRRWAHQDKEYKEYVTHANKKGSYKNNKKA